MASPSPLNQMLESALSQAAEESAEVEAELGLTDESAEEETADEPEEAEEAEEDDSDAPEAEEEAEEDEEEDEEAEEKPAKPAKKGEKKEEKPEEDPFADLKTAKGIEKARNAIETQRAEVEKRQSGLDRGYAKLKTLEKKHETKEKEFGAKLGPSLALIGKISDAWKVVRTSPSVKARFFALGDILGFEGHRAYEELSLEIANDGKAPERNPREVELEQRLRQLEEERVREREAAKVGETRAQAQARLNARRQEIRGKCEDAAAYPTVAEHVSSGVVSYDDVQKYVEDMMRDYHAETGTVLDEADALATLEERLLKSRGVKPAGSGVPPKPVTSPQPSPKPGQRKIGRTVASGSRPVGTRRELSQDERLELLSRDQDFVGEIFGGFGKRR